jgi:KDO2-lipid IV(A) lauroyltransferase
MLYALSDAAYFISFYLIGYRKKVIFQNLRNSFPEKTEKEIHLLTKKFYHYLFDLFLETFKTLTISRSQMLKHCKMSESAHKLFTETFQKHNNIIVVLGHYGNWEWGGNTFSLLFKQQLYVIYHPLRNQHFNQLICKMRTRFGTKLIEMNNTFKAMVSNRNEMNATAFIADQTPQPHNAYWTKFLNQDTPVFWGTEKIARKLNFPVVYITVKRYRRGYYELFAELLEENPAKTNDCEISEKHTKRLEKDIMLQPEIWLWSHRRWKHKKPVT